MQRPNFISKIESSFRVHNIVALLGPRQCGKTTLAQEYFKRQGANPDWYFDLENPVDEQRLSQPMTTLQQPGDLVVIDEVQRLPELFKPLRVITDRLKKKTRFLILGSASRELIRQSSESLAGRIQYIEITPFQLGEVGSDHSEQLWLRGGFPPSYLMPDNQSSRIWRDAYIRTFLEQDLRALGLNIEPTAMRRFWMMLAHYHGQIFNASEISTSLQISDVTAKRYLDILSGTFMIRQVPPWFENIQKRQIKRPKIYFRDSGIYHRLLLLERDESILTHPKLGASWEGFVVEEIIRSLGEPAENIYFWGIHGQAELDLLVFTGGKRWGIEVKYQDVPKITSSMIKAIEHLNLAGIKIIYPGERRFLLRDDIEAVPLKDFVVAPWEKR
jgi:predicted AAA+ superfamily ATPase